MVNTTRSLTLPYSHIDPQSPVPLYHQIYLDLVKMIERGVLLPGDLLPSEMDICHAYNVGRQTVRQALARLVDEDQVERFAGRGTFVRKQRSHIQFFLDRSFSQQMREMNRAPHSRILNMQTGVVEFRIGGSFAALSGRGLLEIGTPAPWR